MPTLRQLVPGAKRRSRADLTVEMISAPLADFRHTMHIGRGGDAFGDTSFLGAKHETANQAQRNGKLRGSKRLQSDRHSSYMLTANSLNSLSPARDDKQTLCRPQSSSIRSAVEDGWSLEEMNPRELLMFTPPPSRGMKPAESMLSFHIDLGPSILTDVLGVMDQSQPLQQNLTEDQTQKQQDRRTPSPLECVSTSCSVTQPNTPCGRQAWSSTYSVNINHRDFLFMDEEEEEIRV